MVTVLHFEIEIEDLTLALEDAKQFHTRVSGRIFQKIIVNFTAGLGFLLYLVVGDFPGFACDAEGKTRFPGGLSHGIFSSLLAGRVNAAQR